MKLLIGLGFKLGFVPILNFPAFPFSFPAPCSPFQLYPWAREIKVLYWTYDNLSRLIGQRTPRVRHSGACCRCIVSTSDDFCIQTCQHHMVLDDDKNKILIKKALLLFKVEQRLLRQDQLIRQRARVLRSRSRVRFPGPDQYSGS